MADTVNQPPCSKCGQADDHPRHHIVRAMGDQLDALAGGDPQVAARLDAAYNTVDHLDCCTCHDDPAVQSTGVETCRDLHARHGHKKGDELRKALIRSPRRITETEHVGLAPAELPTPEVR